MSELEQVDATDRDDVVARINTAAWDEGKTCEHCDGEGKVPGGRRLVHSLGRIFGADWDEAGVIEYVRGAERVVWGDGGGHDLAVKGADGRWMKFQVPHPERGEAS